MVIINQACHGSMAECHYKMGLNSVGLIFIPVSVKAVHVWHAPGCNVTYDVQRQMTISNTKAMLNILSKNRSGVYQSRTENSVK